MRIRITNSSGFTLIEVLVTAGILAIVGTLLGVFTVSGLKEWDRSRSQVEAQESARAALARMTKIIREVKNSDNGSYPLAAATAQSLTVFANVDSDNDQEQIRFFLENSQMKIGIIEPTGSPATYPAGNEAISILASNIRNGANQIFSYYDKNYTSNEAALSIPVNLLNVRLVKINLSIDFNPNLPPLPIEMQTSVTFRNLKDNL